MPTNLPQARLENYSVDLDDTTGVYHVTLRNNSLRASLALTNLSTPDFSSHLVEFWNRKKTTVPRISFARDTVKENAQRPLTRESDKTQTEPEPEPEPERHHNAENQPTVLHSGGTSSTHAESDSAIMEFGRVVSQKAAKDQSSPSSLSKSIIHILPWDTTSTTSIDVEDPNTYAQTQKPLPITVMDIQSCNDSNSSRRSSNASQRTGSSTSTARTSPTSSEFPTVPFEKSALKNLPEVPFVQGKPSGVVKALALEEATQSNPEKGGDPDCISSWDLSISRRQVRHWYKIQEGSSPYLGGLFPRNKELAMTEEGRVIRTGTNMRAI